jgi:hypothetical protein
MVDAGTGAFASIIAIGADEIIGVTLFFGKAG